MQKKEKKATRLLPIEAALDHRFGNLFWRHPHFFASPFFFSRRDADIGEVSLP